MNTPTVKAIDQRSVHQICSGQVVVTLSTALKELVENSLDAGATNIDIRLKNLGADSIEVVDNGSGVLPENFQALALKHHTSKLNVFADLVGVETFGFRGEALSSLCALSDLSITTCHHSKSIGARIEYDHDSKITEQRAAARVPGTTVTLHNLFSTLPVRHKEFLRNVKREYAKLIQVLQSYCVISTGVRFSCQTQSEKGKKNMVLSTNGNAEMKENISNVFGPKQLQTLLEFKQVSPIEEDCEEQGLDITKIDGTPVFHLTGFVSRCDHGAGRSTTDRQYTFINKRPCDLPKVIRVVNEVYHAFNRNQNPFLALNISLNKELVDVNVTPDKRQVFLQQEKLLLVTIKSSLKIMFDPGTSSYEMNEKPLSQIKLGSSTPKPSGADATEFSKSIKDRLLSANTSNACKDRKRYSSILDYTRKKQKDLVEVVLEMKTPLTDCSNSENERNSNNDNNSDSNNSSSNNFIDRNSNKNDNNSNNENDSSSNNNNNDSNNNNDDNSNNNDNNSNNNNNDNNNNSNNNNEDHSKQKIDKENPKPSRSVAETVFSVTRSLEANENLYLTESQDSVEHDEGTNVSEVQGSPKLVASKHVRNVDTLKRKLRNEITSLECQSEEICADRSVSKKMKLEDKKRGDVTNRKTVTVQFDLEKLRTKIAGNREQRSNQARCFRATITPGHNQSAEEELKRHVTKDMFGKMEIIGQFNQGFIISKLKDDLFIIDQHASDEKYNFEEQRKNTVLKSQRLISPQALELTAVNESILIEDIDVFKKNGFDFVIDENAPVSQRVKLVSLPVSRNWSFGKPDIDELIFMLSDSPGVSFRPSNVRKMFASRACRMSIMVGTALTNAQMRRVVGHMGEMEHPWNCPHGRPTMRHVVNLSMVRK